MPDFRLPPEARARIRATLATTQPSFRAHLEATGLNPETDLRGADLRRVRFRGEDLTGIDLSGANLTETDISASPGGYTIDTATLLPPGFTGRPPPDFSQEAARASILAGTPSPPAWRHFVTELNFSNTKKFHDLTPLAGLANLQDLDLDGTGVTALTPLAGLANLQVLDLRGTGVTDLTPLAGLANLQTLWLSGTGVTALTPLAGLVNLQALSLTGLPPGIESALPRRAEINITRD